MTTMTTPQVQDPLQDRPNTLGLPVWTPHLTIDTEN